MKTIIDSTRKILFEDDIAQEAMSTGILNFSAYAEKILHAVELDTRKPVKKGSIVVALTRIAQEMNGQAVLRPQLILDTVSIRSPLCSVTFNKTQKNRAKLATIPQFVSSHENAFVTITQGMTEITIVASQTLLENILEHFNEEPKALYTDRAGISVRFSEEYLSVPNVLYTIQAALAVHKTNFVEIISTYTEFSFIIDKEYVEASTKALQRFLK